MTPRSLLAPARLAGQPILRSQTDERLVDLVRAGHEAAFEAIVARYRRPLLRYCGGILLTGERADDAVQQTFVKAYEAMRRDDAELNLRPWLYRIAHNTALNGLRDRSLKDEPLDPQFDGVERPDQVAERRQGLRDVLAAVQSLPVRQRDAIVLREMEGRSYEEIAGELGVTGGAVRQLLNRARTSVRTAATAITPIGLLLRLPSAEDPVSGRVAELVGGAGAGAVAAKVGATVLVTGAVAGGVAGLPSLKEDQSSRAKQTTGERATDPREGVTRDSSETGAAVPGEDRRERHGHGREREAGDDHGGRRGRGGREADDRDGHSGPGGGGEDRSGHGGGDDSGGGSGDSSGPGSGSREAESGSGSNSGPGSGSGSGSGSGESGSGGGSGSGSGGKSGSGSGSSEESGSGSESDDPLGTD